MDGTGDNLDLPITLPKTTRLTMKVRTVFDCSSSLRCMVLFDNCRRRICSATTWTCAQWAIRRHGGRGNVGNEKSTGWRCTASTCRWLSPGKRPCGASCGANKVSQTPRSNSGWPGLRSWRGSAWAICAAGRAHWPTHGNAGSWSSASRLRRGKWSWAWSMCCLALLATCRAVWCVVHSYSTFSLQLMWFVYLCCRNVCFPKQTLLSRRIGGERHRNIVATICSNLRNYSYFDKLLYFSIF